MSLLLLLFKFFCLVSSSSSFLFFFFFFFLSDDHIIIIMDAILKAVEINDTNAWSTVSSEKAFLSFLNAANVHDASAFFSNTTTNDNVGARRLPNSLPMSCLPTGAMTLSVDLDVDDAVLEALRRDGDDGDDGDEESAVARLNAHAKGGNIDSLRLLILICLRTKATAEEKLSLMFKQMERNRGFGVTLEQVHEWIEDCETVIGTAMKSFVRKEREDALAEENTVNEAPSSPNNEIERSASMIRRKKMSLSLGELKKKEENTMHSLRWMRGKMEVRFKKYFQTHGVAMHFQAFTETVSEILEMWSTEAMDSVEMAFKETRTYDSFSERIDRAEVLGGNEGISSTRRASHGEHRRQNSGNSTSSIGTNVHGHLHPRRRSSFSINKNQNQSGGILETVARTMKKVESAGINHERALSDDRLSNLSNPSLPRSPTLSRQNSEMISTQSISPTHSKENLFSSVDTGGGGGSMGVNPNTIVSYLPQQYRHVIGGAFDVLGMGGKSQGHTFAPGDINALGQENDDYLYEENFAGDDADSAHMTEAQKRRRDLKSELLESEQEFIDVEKQQEGFSEDTSWKRLVAFFREVTIRLFLYNVVKMLLIIALLAGDAALCMFVVNNFGVVSGLGVVVTINLGFAGIFTYSMLKFQRREKGLRNMEFGQTWVRQTDHILHGNNSVVNNALKAAETAHKVENMKLAGGGTTTTANDKSGKPQSPASGEKKDKASDRFRSAREHF